MKPEQIEFLALIENSEPCISRPEACDWMPHALKVIHLVPEMMSKEDAAAAFLRWLDKEPSHEHDGVMLDILTRGSILKT
jgi:hypothetical protein